MAQSIAEAFRLAATKQAQKEQKALEIEPDDYPDQGVSFIRSRTQLEEVFIMPAPTWYRQVVDGMKPKVRNEFEHFHLGGMVVIAASELAKILAWKEREGMPTQILTKTPTSDTPNLIVVTFLNIYAL